jgi:hypothetical protein
MLVNIPWARQEAPARHSRRLDQGRVRNYEGLQNRDRVGCADMTRRRRIQLFDELVGSTCREKMHTVLE